MGGGSRGDDEGDERRRRRGQGGNSVAEFPKTCEAQCWGCSLWLVLPGYTPAFKCGWCGALTINKPRAPRSKWQTRLWICRDRALVAAVFLIIGSVLCGGVWATFPVLFPSVTAGLIVHTTITFLLSFNTFFNFAVSSFIAPGPTQTKSWGDVSAVPRGSLDGYTFCDYCKWPKPRNAHHCRTCETCVLDMDHHCPFIGNCVGANNHRHFILFLVYTVVGGLYVFGMALYTGLRVWPEAIRAAHGGGLRGGGGVGIISPGLAMGASAVAAVAAAVLQSGRAVALLYLAVAGVAVVTGVGILLHQQLAFLYSGTTFLDTKQRGPHRAARDGQGWANLRRVFGPGLPAFWALPILPEATPRKIHVR